MHWRSSPLAAAYHAPSTLVALLPDAIAVTDLKDGRPPAELPFPRAACGCAGGVGEAAPLLAAAEDGVYALLPPR